MKWRKRVNDREKTEHWEFQTCFPEIPLEAHGIYTGRCDEVSRCAKGVFGLCVQNIRSHIICTSLLDLVGPVIGLVNELTERSAKT